MKKIVVVFIALIVLGGSALDQERKLLELTNQERSQELKSDFCLKKKAQERAFDLYINDYFDHIDPKTGEEPFIEMVKECGRFLSAGENLAKNFKTMEQAHLALMDSPSHKENIINENYTRAGYGCYKTVCVQLFSSEPRTYFWERYLK